MRTNPAAILIAQGLKRHRQSDHLSKKIVQPNHRTSKPASLEVFPETYATLGESSLPFRISGFATLLRFQHQSELVAKRMRIALGAAAALESNFPVETTLEQDTFSDAADFELKDEGLLDLANLALSLPFPRVPPFAGRLEAKGFSLLAEPLDRELEIRHFEVFRANAMLDPSGVVPNKE